jgi:multimeric flavodoxin WrbA
MRLIIHDLTPEQENSLLTTDDNTRVIADDGSIRPCVGCFGCWIKSPGKCVIRDRYADIGSLLGHCDELVLVSRCCYGGFSPFVKNVLDRSISQLLPYFTIRNGEMHHTMRYPHALRVRAYFYADGIPEQDKARARSLMQANAINYCADVEKVEFAKTPEAFGGKIQ